MQGVAGGGGASLLWAPHGGVGGACLLLCDFGRNWSLSEPLILSPVDPGCLRVRRWDSPPGGVDGIRLAPPFPHTLLSETR